MPADALEQYLRDLRDIHSSGAGVKETSYYGRLENLLNAVGAGLKPKVKAIIHLTNKGAGIPDGGLFTSDQFERGQSEPQKGQPPARGAIEIKGTSEDLQKLAKSKQVSAYLAQYGTLLITNYRDFLVIARQADGAAKQLEGYSLASTEQAFWAEVSDPHTLAQRHSGRFEEFLERAMLHNAPISDPADLAWFLASYAREAKSRVAQASNLNALKGVRKALEDGLGINFDGAKGEQFFQSTLVQTLFYGLFSAWVLWNDSHGDADEFDWKNAGWELHIPVMSELFHQLSNPRQLQALGLVEIMGWAGDVLNRVVKAEFFKRFQLKEAVRYFYEPFLEAFDPELRKQFGVWYTPHEVVEYMVERVDRSLRDDLGIALGLEDENVIVLDPCTGTGSFVVEVLRRINHTLAANGAMDALSGSDLKQAAMKRVLGFEVMPAPFVVAHLQIGLLLKNLGDPFIGEERAGVYLTNALTGWKSGTPPKPITGLEGVSEERDAAQAVKQSAKILVVIGNPPYSGYAGISRIEEERDLSEAYRTVKRAPAPRGQGLNELYVRFFRMAEREISSNQRGIVSFISNYSWLDGLSFTGMREHYLETFDQISVDNLNGDKYRTGKVAPDGSSDPSIFSTPYNREGIQVGTAVVTMVKTSTKTDPANVQFRNLWGKGKLEELRSDAVRLTGGVPPAYSAVSPPAELGYPFTPAQVGQGYLEWALLPEIFPTSFPGVKTSRDEFLTDIDCDQLEARIKKYFDKAVSHEAMARESGMAMLSASRFDAMQTREYLQKRGFKKDGLMRYAYRPFDFRWLYWEAESKLLDEKRTDYISNVFPENKWLSSTHRVRKDDFYQPQVSSVAADLNLIEANVAMFPVYLEHRVILGTGEEIRERTPNLSAAAKHYLEQLSCTPENLFHHALAPHYRSDNAGALRQDWPRIPLPSTGAALRSSAALGRQLAALLDPLNAVDGVTGGAIRPELRVIGAVSRVAGAQGIPDLEVKARWGYYTNGKTMPGAGKTTVRAFTPEEQAVLEPLGLGENAVDVYLNDGAYWRCVPSRVWTYTLGGYQVIKKWLSYREYGVLHRALTVDEAREVTGMARRIAAMLLLEPALDANFSDAQR